MPLDRRVMRERSFERCLLVYGYSQCVERLETPQLSETISVALTVSVWPVPSVHRDFPNEFQVKRADIRFPRVDIIQRRREESILAKEDSCSFLLCPVAELHQQWNSA